MSVENKQQIETNLENQENQKRSKEKHWLRNSKIFGLIGETISRSRQYFQELHEDTKRTW